MSTEKQIATAERRYHNCMIAHRTAKKGTWAYDFWLRTACAVKRNSDIQRSTALLNPGTYLPWDINFSNEK
jgi:hypothetical protein